MNSYTLTGRVCGFHNHVQFDSIPTNFEYWEPRILKIPCHFTGEMILEIKLGSTVILSIPVHLMEPLSKHKAIVENETHTLYRIPMDVFCKSKGFRTSILCDYTLTCQLLNVFGDKGQTVSIIADTIPIIRHVITDDVYTFETKVATKFSLDPGQTLVITGEEFPNPWIHGLFFFLSEEATIYVNEKEVSAVIHRLEDSLFAEVPFHNNPLVCWDVDKLDHPFYHNQISVRLEKGKGTLYLFCWNRFFINSRNEFHCVSLKPRIPPSIALL